MNEGPLLLNCPRFGKLVTLDLCLARFQASVRSRELAEKGGYPVPDLPCLKCTQKPTELPPGEAAETGEERKPLNPRRIQEKVKRKPGSLNREGGSLKRIAVLIGEIMGGLIDLSEIGRGRRGKGR